MDPKKEEFIVLLYVCMYVFGYERTVRFWEGVGERKEERRFK